jgi:hypothetical protein
MACSACISSGRVCSSIVNRGGADSSKAVHSRCCAVGHRRHSDKRIFGAKNAPAAKAAGYDPKAHAAGFVSVTPAVTATAENAFVPGRASVSSGRELNTSLA